MRCDHHTFQAIGRLSGLHHCHLPQVAQNLRRLGDVELLLATVLAQSAQRCRLPGIKAQLDEVVGQE